MIKVLIVEDSRVIQEFLMLILGSDPEIKIVGVAQDGSEALEQVRRSRPDVITMDFNMPGMNGVDATRKIMEAHPTPIVIVTGSSSAQEVAITFRALEAGALTVVNRPAGIGDPGHEAAARDLIQTVKLMSEVKVVRRFPRRVSTPPGPSARPIEHRVPPAELQVVAIGASTGGPVVCQKILSSLPKNFPAPVLLVQHITAGFVRGFADWLAQSSGLPVHVAGHGDPTLPGHVFVAPDGFHMLVDQDRSLALSSEPPENGLRPSVSALFRSVARVYGRHAVGVLLSGMGKDGAEELRLIKDRGGITMVQNQESSVVFGMAGEAVRLEAATYVMAPESIAEVLHRLTGQI